MATNGIKEIKVSNTNYLIEPTLYTTIKQTSATATFTADLANFELFTGVTVAVKFGVTNNSSATLNINGTGAKAIYYEGAAIAANKLKAKHTYVFTYNGTQWELVGDLDTDTNTHRPIQVNSTEILGNNTTALNLKNGNNVSITNDNGTVTIAATDTKSFTITANATDGYWNLTGTSGTNAVTYALAPYSSKQSGASFYTGTTNPDGTTRLNYNGYLYATKLYSEGNEVLTIQATSKPLSSAGWYRILDCTKYSMAFFITFYGGYNNQPPTPATFLVSHAYNTTTIEQIGRSANIGWIQQLRAVHYDTSKFYIDVYYAGDKGNIGAFEITPLDPNARSNITLIDFTEITETVTANASCSTSLESHADKAEDANTVGGLTVKTAVPVNAVFTDTNKYHKSGSWSGLTYTATAVNSADELKFTIPDNYGDTKNPYGTKAKNLVLAGPSSGSNAAPSFRALVAADIPDLSGTYLKLTGGTMTGGINLVGNQSSAYNDKGLIFTQGSRIGENTNGGLGIYAAERIYLRPDSPTSSSGDGIEISGSGMIPSNNNTETLGDSSHKWSNVYATNLHGNLSVTTHTNTTNGNKNYYPWFSTATSGNLGAKAHAGVYIYETVASGAISSLDFCMGSTSITGSLTLWDGTNHWGNIKPTNLSANRNYTLPNQAGTFALLTRTDANALINLLDTGASDLTANDYVITQYVGGGTTTTTYHRRPASKVVNATLVKAALGTVGTTAKKFLKDTGSWVQVDWGDLTGKPTSFTPATHNHSQIVTVGDNRSVATTPNSYSNKIIFQGLKGKATIDNPSNDTYSYLVGLRGWDNNSGGDSWELAFNNSGINARHGATTTWNAWKTIAFTDSTVARATADASGNTITSTYAPLASPALTGTPTAPTAANGTNTTQIATTAFVMSQFKYNDAMIYKGVVNANADLPATHYQGWTYKVATAGTYAGIVCEIGDMIICNTDGTSANNTHWNVIQTNIDGAVIGPAAVSSGRDNSIVRFSGETGKLIQGSKAKLDDNGDFLIANDASIKFYRQTNTTYGLESYAIQTCFDDQDPATSAYTTTYEYRCNLLLQPRGGQVYIGTDLTSVGDKNYSLYVTGDTYLKNKLIAHGLEIKGHIAGDAGTTGHGLWSGGGYHNAYNNIILHGDSSTGSSGIAFISDKIGENDAVTSINQPSDRAFIQYHAHGVTTPTAESTAPTIATSGEKGTFVIGIGNDGTGSSQDQLWLQTNDHLTLIHQIAANSYVIPDTGNTTGSVGNATQPVYIDAGVIKACTAYANASVNYATSAGSASKATAANLTTTANGIAYYSNTTGTFANSNLKYYEGAANAGGAYIGWVKFVSIDIGSNNYWGDKIYDIFLDRTYNSPSSEVYNIRVSAGWTNSNIIQLSGHAGKQIITKFRIVRDHNTHKAYFEYYVDPSYSTYQNVVYIKILGYHGAAVTLINEVQTEEDSAFAYKEEIDLANGMVSNGNFSGTFNGNATGISATGGSTAKFWRGDNTWSDTISGGTLKITNQSNTVTIGSQNASFTHIYNSATVPFIFNNTVLTTSGNLGNTTYPFNNLYIGAKGSKGIYYVGTNSTNQMITFVDNTSDANGNGIKIGGGGVIVIGSGESSALSVTGGDENLYLISDSIAYLEANAQTLANRIGISINASGHVIPVKAESANNNAQNLGSSSAKWANVYATTFTGDLSGNASSATRINGNLGSLTDTSKHNIWVSSTNSADGIPKYVTGVYVTASTGVITANGFKGSLSGNATTATAAHWYTSAGSPTGVIKVKIKKKQAWMLAFTIRVYQAYTYDDYVISGYNYGSNKWYSPEATILGSESTSKHTVTFGYDDDADSSGYRTLWVSIPVKQYTGIDIFNVTNGFSQITDMSDAFEIIHETESTGTVQTTVDCYRPWYRNETVSNATTATNLSAKPSLAASGNNITVTAGGKTSDTFTVPYATSAGSATTATSLTDFVVSKYTIAAGKGVRITYPTQAPVLISVQTSLGEARLILIGGGYGAQATVRNDFTEIVSCSTRIFTWSLPDSSSISNSIEIMDLQTNTDGNVVVWSKAACTFTEITALTTAATNRTLLHSSNYTDYAVAKTAGVTAVTWDATNKKLTRTINGTAADVMTAAQMSTALELGTIASKAATDYLPYKGNVTALGSGSPSATVKTWWENTTNVPKLSVLAAYNNSGSEKTMIFSKGNADKTYGTVLAWGHGDKYIRILRKNNADSWISSDWEKIDAGYADSADYATQLSFKNGRIASADLDISTMHSKMLLTLASSSMTTSKPPMGDGYIVTYGWDNAYWGAQQAISHTKTPHMAIRGTNGGSTNDWGDWIYLLDANNYTDYTVTKTGTGASGTWGISITGSSASCTGNAATASKLTAITTTDAASSSATWRRLWISYSNNTEGRPAYTDSLVYQTSTNTLKTPHLLVEHASGGQQEIHITYSDTIDYWWGVGTANENHGLYDNKAAKWILSAGTANTWTFVGNVTGNVSGTAANVTGTVAIAHGGTGLTSADPHKVLIGPSTGTAAAAPTWRTIVAADLPSASTSAAGIIQIGTAATNAMAGNTTVTNVAISANTTTNANYPVVFATTNKDTTTAKTEGLQKSGAKFYFNPSTGILTATGFAGALTGNVTGNVTGSSGSCTGNAATASKISAKLAATTKTYLLGTSTAITTTAANVNITGDTGVYLTTTAGELSAARHSWNVSGTEKAYTIYNTTDDSIDFVFI